LKAEINVAFVVVYQQYTGVSMQMFYLQYIIQPKINAFLQSRC